MGVVSERARSKVRIVSNVTSLGSVLKSPMRKMVKSPHFVKDVQLLASGGAVKETIAKCSLAYAWAPE